jgi:hypothetical protein
MDDALKRKKRHLGWAVAAVFIVAMVMGSGPGLYLVNPDLADPEARFTVLGLPTIYAWGLLWYAVQLAAVLLAYFKVWTGGDEADG